MALPRVFVKCATLDKPPHIENNHRGGDGVAQGRYLEQQQYEDVPEEDANLISSRLAIRYHGADLHAPALDIDLPVECYESSTPGHYHVFIDVPISWRRYKKMLRAMAKAGVIEWGYYKASVKHKATHLRKKNVKKPPPQQQQQNQEQQPVAHTAWSNWQ